MYQIMEHTVSLAYENYILHSYYIRDNKTTFCEVIIAHHMGALSENFNHDDMEIT